MKANLNDATHYNERTDEYWLLEDGVYYLHLNGFWQVARPEEIKAGHGNLRHHALINL